MYQILEKRLSRLEQTQQEGLLSGGLKGIEKESLRITPNGSIAQSDHPTVLGATLTHPHITTDFSEALLELVTPPLRTAEECVNFQAEIHTFIYQYLEDELMWSASMPCVIRGEDGIPIARYGHIQRWPHEGGVSKRASCTLWAYHAGN